MNSARKGTLPTLYGYFPLTLLPSMSRPWLHVSTVSSTAAAPKATLRSTMHTSQYQNFGLYAV